MSDETWIYPAPAWEAGDRVAVDDEGHPWHDSLGVVVGPDEWDEGAWLVRLDNGEEISAYTHELTGVVGPERYTLPATHVHTAACEHRLVSHEVPGVSECYSCGPHIRDQYCPHTCTVVAEETA